MSASAASALKILQTAVSALTVIRELTEIAGEINALLSQLEAEGRDLTEAELIALQSKTDALGDRVRDRLQGIIDNQQGA